MRGVIISFVTAVWLSCYGVTFGGDNKEPAVVDTVRMAMTVLEAQVAQPNWPKLSQAYAEKTKKLPPGLVQTFLVQSRTDNTVWRIISVWESQAALDDMRRTTETPGGVLIFRAAGAEPKLSVYSVDQHVRH
jgi:quinol monooxygenase YgiN